MRAFFCLLLIGAGACASAPSQTTTSPTPARDTAQAAVGRGAISTPNADPFPSTYVAFPARTTVIRNVNILTAAGPLIRNGAILMQNGKIARVGATVDAPADALVIDGGGKYVTPGIVDHTLTPESVRDQFDKIRDESGYEVPPNLNAELGLALKEGVDELGQEDGIADEVHVGRKMRR